MLLLEPSPPSPTISPQAPKGLVRGDDQGGASPDSPERIDTTRGSAAEALIGTFVVLVAGDVT
jgi:hypothetical protein